MGPYMSQPKKEKVYDQNKGKKVEFCAASMQGWRNTMEDSHIAEISIDGDDDACVFGVFDGHGGSEVAQFVKKYFVQELSKNPNFKSKQNLGDALKETFISIDKRMITKEGIKELHQLRDPSRTGNNTDYDLQTIYAGCTANVCLIYNNQLYVANSGDSRSVLCSKDQPFAMSIDHKPDDKIELERIRAAGGFVAEGRVNGNLNLSRAMGDFEYKDISEQGGDKVYPKDPEKTMITVVPDIKSKNLIATDRFLLMGCDGIWECKSNEELMEFIIQRLDRNTPLKSILEELLDTILAKDCSEGIGCDNMTVILVVFNNTK
ncbi:hypothetical protein ABPG74_004209 [Tetrahymena malaccensis]